MRVLFLGDIVAKSGRDAVLAQLGTLKEQYQPDFVIVNAENSAHGKGITFKIYNQLLLSASISFKSFSIVMTGSSRHTSMNTFPTRLTTAIRFPLTSLIT